MPKQADVRKRPALHFTFGGERFERRLEWSFNREYLKGIGETFKEKDQKYRIVPFNKRFFLYVSPKPKQEIKHPLYIIPR